MAKSLSDIVRGNNTATKTTQHQLGPDDFPEYAGSNTDGLYVVGYKGDSRVKIKVRSNSFCDGIDLGSSGIPGYETGLKHGKTYATFRALYDDRNNLELDTIYTVADKGTSEQYICLLSEDGVHYNIAQTSGGINVILANKNISDCPLDLSSGIINYPLPELVCGDFFFKGHDELHTFIGDMPSLETGVEMFWNTNLTTFSGELSSLRNGDRMFGRGVKLDANSILCIVDSLSFVDSGKIHIGYDTSKVTAKEIKEFENEFTTKGWTVTWYPDGQEIINTFRLKRG